MIKVHVIDDHIILVDGLCKLINSSGFATVSNIAYNGKDCWKNLQLEIPDVVMLDINLQDTNGIELCKEIKQRYNKLKIIALTGFCEYAIVRQMLDNGADGYVLKNAMPEEIIMSIDVVMSGERFLCEEIDMLMRKRSANAVWLTPREKELLKHIVDGYTNIEIADKMCLAVETINGYRKNLLYKLGVKNTALLVRMAIEEKLL